MPLSPDQQPPVSRRSEMLDANAPDGSDIRLLVDGRHHATRASLVEVSLAAGQVSKPVWHRTVEEIWFVLEGDGQVWRCSPHDVPTAADIVTVSQGDALVIPTTWRFQFRAGPACLLRFLCYTAPPWPGESEAVLLDFGGLGAGTV